MNGSVIDLRKPNSGMALDRVGSRNIQEMRNGLPHRANHLAV